MSGCLRRIGIALAVVVGLLTLAMVVSQVSAGARIRRQYDIRVEPVPIPSDEAAIERGRQLVIAGRCTECHGANLAGRVTADDAAVGQIYASNLTSGLGGVGRTYGNEDWVRAIRHGVGQDGRSLIITPAQYYSRLSDDDLGAIIAYIRSRPPIDNELPSASVGPLGRLFLTLFNPRDWLPAEKIDHEGPRPAAPRPGANAEYGEYLVQITTCLVCHNTRDLSAGPNGALAGWSESDFVDALRLGIGSDHNFDIESMRATANQLSDDDLRAMWLYLQELK